MIREKLRVCYRFNYGGVVLLVVLDFNEPASCSLFVYCVYDVTISLFILDKFKPDYSL